MGAVLVPIVFVLVVLVVAAVAAKQFAGRQEHKRGQLVEDRSSLLYELPDGQDPAVVVAALTDEGYDASIDERAGERARVLIGTSGEAGEPDRERVRRVLAGTRRLNFEGDTAELPAPRFTDE